MSNGRYPLTTHSGVPIPLDVYRPRSLLTVTLSTSPSTPTSLPSGSEVFMFRASVDCWIRFDSTQVAVPTPGTPQSYTTFLAAGEIHNIAPPFLLFSHVASAAGTLIVQGVENWAGLGTPLAASSI